jgi:hypothetical protein
MTSPINSSQAYSYFGLILGALPPFTMVIKWIGGTTSVEGPSVFLVLLALAGAATGLVGYSTGRFIPVAVRYASKFRFPNRVLLLSMFGLAWGGVSGLVGGLFLSIIGSIFAGILGGVAGAITLPVLVALHSMMRRGDLIETKHFVPIAFGITLTVCALILGL